VANSGASPLRQIASVLQASRGKMRRTPRSELQETPP